MFAIECSGEEIITKFAENDATSFPYIVTTCENKVKLSTQKIEYPKDRDILICTWKLR